MQVSEPLCKRVVSAYILINSLGSNCACHVGRYETAGLISQFLFSMRTVDQTPEYAYRLFEVSRTTASASAAHCAHRSCASACGMHLVLVYTYGTFSFFFQATPTLCFHPQTLTTLSHKCFLFFTQQSYSVFFFYPVDFVCCFLSTTECHTKLHTK